MAKHASAEPLTDAEAVMTNSYIQNLFIRRQWGFIEYRAGRISDFNGSVGWIS
jgi:hypothetical protein